MGKTTATDASNEKIFESMDEAGKAMLENSNLQKASAKNNGKIVPIVRVQKNDWQRGDESQRMPIPSYSTEKVLVAILRAPRQGM